MHSGVLKRARRALGLAATIGLLAACAGSDIPNPAPCPRVAVLHDAARFVSFDGPASAETVAYSGEVLRAEGACRYFEDKPIIADLTITMAFGRGPKGADRTEEFNYFVAVTRTDRAVIHKEVYPIRVTFPRGEDVVQVTQRIDEIVIPRATERVSGTNFEILTGFQLSLEQVNFNRSGASLKFPDLR